MNLVGATTAVRMTSRALVDRAFALRSFSFSLDPGTGATHIEGTLSGLRLDLVIRNSSGERHETRQLAEAPALSLNLPRALAARGLEPGQTHVVSVFDPSTLRNTPMTVEVQAREVVRAAGRPVPAFRVEERLAGVTHAVVDHRRRRGRARGEPDGPAGGARDARSRRRRSPSPARSRPTCSKRARSCPCAPGASTTRAPSRGSACGSTASTGLDAGRPLGRRPVERRRDDRGDGRARPQARPGPGRPRAVPGRRGVPGERRPGDPRRGGEGGGGRLDTAAARRAARPLRPRHRREAADREPALGPRGAQDPGRRLQRAHGALRRDGPLAGPAGAHRRRARVPARRLLLPRLGRGLDRRGARAAASGSPSTRPSTSSRPTPRTCASRAAASTARRRSSA